MGTCLCKNSDLNKAATQRIDEDSSDLPPAGNAGLTNNNHHQVGSSLNLTDKTILKIKTLSSKDFPKITKCEEKIDYIKSERELNSKSRSSNNIQINLPQIKPYLRPSNKRSKSIQIGLMDEIIKSKTDNEQEENIMLNNEIIEEDEEEDKSEDLTEHKLNKYDEAKIREVLRNHFIFKDLTEDILQIVLNDLIYYRIQKGMLLYEEKSEGNYFYIVAEGELEMESKCKNIKRIYRTWESFGELPLLLKGHREESVRCLSDVAVYVLDGNSFRDVQSRMYSIRLKENFSYLDLIPMFKVLDNVSRYNLAERMKMIEFLPMDKIISMGDVGDNLYMIKEGLVTCRSNGKEIRKLGNNDFFGENSLLIDTRRTLDIIAIQKTVLYSVSKNDLLDALGQNYKNQILYSLFRFYMQENSYFREILIESNINDLFNCFKLKVYANRQSIHRQNETNRRIIIVLEGALINKNTEETVAKKGDVFGKDIIESLIELPKDIIAYPDCISFECDFEPFAKILKIDLGTKSINALNRINKLKRISIFRDLSDTTLHTIAMRMKKEKFKKDDLIIEENTIAEKFYLITKGHVQVIQNKKVIREQESGSCFGETALINSGEKRTATVVALENVICYSLTKQELEEIVGEKMINDYLKKKFYLQDTSSNLSDFYYLKFLGRGQFGTVYLVQNKSGNIYAVKSISRRNADMKPYLRSYFIQERKIMLSLDHPFIVKLVKTLKNQDLCFFMLEYVNGKNLDNQLKLRKFLHNLDETRFYIANILLMIEYLHKRNIAHRDIKPSNIMVDHNGYLKLIDFGTSKVINNFTSTIIGTPHYMAPEIISGKGYSLSCDFWSIGICVYEIFYGFYPFGQNAHDTLEVYKEILNKDLSLPSANKKKYLTLNSFLKLLLIKKVNLRCCSLTKLKQTIFFEHFDWDSLKEFKLTPPCIPETLNLSKYQSNTLTTFEKALFTEQTNARRRDSNNMLSRESPKGFISNWADEF